MPNVLETIRETVPEEVYVKALDQFRLSQWVRSTQFSPPLGLPKAAADFLNAVSHPENKATDDQVTTAQLVYGLLILYEESEIAEKTQLLESLDVVMRVVKENIDFFDEVDSAAQYFLNLFRLFAVKRGASD